MHHFPNRTTAALALTLAACGGHEAPPVADTDTLGADRPDGAAPGDNPEFTVPQQRAATREDTILIEGMPEVETSTLVTAPAGFAAPFSTYVPEGLQTRFEPPSTARFTAAFGGQVNNSAFMAVTVQDAGAANVSAAAILEEFMQTRGAAEHEAVAIDQPSWAVDAIGFRSLGKNGTDYSGSIIVAEHGDQVVHIFRHYPVEYGDGLGPRLHMILSDWRWEDTGAMLMR